METLHARPVNDTKHALAGVETLALNRILPAAKTRPALSELIPDRMLLFTPK